MASPLSRGVAAASLLAALVIAGCGNHKSIDRSPSETQTKPVPETTGALPQGLAVLISDTRVVASPKQLTGGQPINVTFVNTASGIEHVTLVANGAFIGRANIDPGRSSIRILVQQAEPGRLTVKAGSHTTSIRVSGG